jgi:hypothetical protein
MDPLRPQNPYGPLVVPASLLFGFLYVGWMGYSSEDPEPLHQALAFFFEANFTTIGAALFVSAWALYAVRLNLRRQRQAPPLPFPALARALGPRLGLAEPEPSLGRLAQAAEALGRSRFEEEELPHVAGELGSWLGEALCRERGARWERRDDPELGPFAVQASSVLLPQQGQPPVRINVFSVALRALRDPEELPRFGDEVERAASV